MFDGFLIDDYSSQGSEKDLLKENAVQDTIVALATPAGIGGVAVVRVSGEKQFVLTLACKLLNKTKQYIKPRYAHYSSFYSCDNEVLDKGIAIYFAAPHSYTGEDVLELHCHGGPVVVDRIISNLLQYNIRLAEPGEFTKRAWLNGKMDLAQVEAVSDLINATSKQAAQSALNTLDGSFSKIINNFLLDLISFRTFVEAAIDFSDQEIDFIQDGDVANRLDALIKRINDTFDAAEQGVILQEGVKIAIAGKPNAGKSSLLNAMCKKEEAIVTNIPGTTRDVVKSSLSIKGVPVTLLDTAGLRETDDRVEQEGIKRAIDSFIKADCVLHVVDCSEENVDNLSSGILSDYKEKTLTVYNKIDKISNWNHNGQEDFIKSLNNNDSVSVSAKCGIGIVDLENLILNKVGYKQTNEGMFIARRRHLESIKKVQQCLDNAKNYLSNQVSFDLIAEELRAAQVYLGEITGEYTPDDLLGNIFSSFCIGK